MHVIIGKVCVGVSVAICQGYYYSLIVFHHCDYSLDLYAWWGGLMCVIVLLVVVDRTTIII
jgi:hypothetical protein